MYYVYGFEADVDNAAKEFLAHEDVEFADFQGMDGFTATSNRIAAEQPQPMPIVATPPTSITEPTTMLAAAPFAGKPLIKPALKPQATAFEDPTNLFPSSSNNDSAIAKRYLAGRTGGERGACCTDDGCENLTMEDCRSIGGTYRGAFTHCDSGICEATRAVFGGCCFQDEIVAPVTLSQALTANNSTINGSFGVDIVAEGGANTSNDGPGNPYVVKNCQIVQDVGIPADENYVPASEVCGEAQGTYLGNFIDCSNNACGNFGGCCVDGDCDNQLRDDCEGLDIHGTFADGIGLAAGTYWPTMPEGTLPGLRTVRSQLGRGRQRHIRHSDLDGNSTQPCIDCRTCRRMRFG